MKEEIPYGLIAAYLAGETSEGQNKDLYEWVDRAKENRQIFNELTDIWGASFSSASDMAESERLIHRKVLAKTRIRRIFRPALHAACLVAVASAGFGASIFINNEEEAEPVVLAPSGEITLTTLPGQKAEATLPDSTKVWLNSGTTISYPAAYGIEERTAKLIEGEIFLEVAKDKEMPFVLKTSKGVIKVHGTSFNVRDYASDPSMAISLKEGSIEYIASDNKSKVMMVPGQKIVLDKAAAPTKAQEAPVEKTSEAMVLQKCDTETEAVWRFGELKIEREGFMDVMADMERWYGVEIEVSGDIPKDSYYWMTIKTESLREMLGLLTKITPLTYEINGKDVSIRVK